MSLSTSAIDRTNPRIGAMTDPGPPNPKFLGRSAGRRPFSANYRAQIPVEYDTLSQPERGALLRRVDQSNGQGDL